MLANWTKATTTTTGTGTITLAAVTGFPRPSDSLTVGEYIQYSIVTSDGKMEAGVGKVAATNTLERTKVFSTFNGTTYDKTTATALTLVSGTHEVFITNIAETAFEPLHFPLVGPTTPVVTSTHLQTTPSNDTILGATNRAVAYPFRLETSGILTAIGVNVAVAGDASSRMQLGLYEPDSNGRPGRLIAKLATVIDTSSTGWKSNSVNANARLTPGWYWVALVVTAGTQPTLSFLVQNQHAFCQAAGSNGGLTKVYENAGATDLADPFPSTSLVYVTENGPKSPKVGLSLS